MLIGDGFCCFQLNHQKIIYKQIRNKVAEDCSILVQHLNGMLLLDFDSQFAETMGQCVFIHSFKVTMPVINVNGVSRSPHNVAQLKDASRGHLVFFVSFCG